MKFDIIDAADIYGCILRSAPNQNSTHVIRIKQKFLSEIYASRHAYNQQSHIYKHQTAHKNLVENSSWTIWVNIQSQ
jgi:hypothetical protein